MTPTRMFLYWYQETDESIPVMVKLDKVVMPYIELIQEKNTTYKLTYCFKVYAYMNPHLLSEYDHQII